VRVRGGWSDLDNRLKSNRNGLESTVKEATELQFQPRNGASKDWVESLDSNGNRVGYGRASKESH